jgi:Ca2+-binding RTX toxin-like protein
VLIGSDGNDILLGGAGDDVLIGGPGIDILDGGEGDNVVIQGFGFDTVLQGFKAGAGSTDRIDLTRFGGKIDYEWVMTHAQQTKADVILDLGTETVALKDTSMASLHADDFIFGEPMPLEQMLMDYAGVSVLPVESYLIG